MPVLTIVGALDASDHVRMVQRLAEGVQDARSVVVEGTAHMPNMERPDIFNEHVLTFLGGVAA